MTPAEEFTWWLEEAISAYADQRTRFLKQLILSRVKEHVAAERRKALEEFSIPTCGCCGEFIKVDIEPDIVRCGPCCVGCVMPLGEREWKRGQDCPSHRR